MGPPHPEASSDWRSVQQQLTLLSSRGDPRIRRWSEQGAHRGLGIRLRVPGRAGRARVPARRCRYLGRCVAEVERVDLRRKGIGDGRHGFRVPLGRALESGGTYRIAVRASVDGTLLPLVAGYLSDGGGAGSEPVVLTLDQGPASVEGPSSPVLHGTGGWLFPDDGPATLARSLASPRPTRRRCGTPWAGSGNATSGAQAWASSAWRRPRRRRRWCTRTTSRAWRVARRSRRSR